MWRARLPPLSSAHIARDPWCRTRPTPLLPSGHEVVQEGRGRLRRRRPAQPMCTCDRPFCFRRQSRSGKPGALRARCADAAGRQRGGAARNVQRAPPSPSPDGAMGMKALSAASRKPVSGSWTRCSGPRLRARAHQCRPPGRLPGSACRLHVKVTAPAGDPRRSIRGRTGLSPGSTHAGQARNIPSTLRGRRRRSTRMRPARGLLRPGAPAPAGPLRRLQRRQPVALRRPGALPGAGAPRPWRPRVGLPRPCRVWRAQSAARQQSMAPPGGPAVRIPVWPPPGAPAGEQRAAGTGGAVGRAWQEGRPPVGRPPPGRQPRCRLHAPPLGARVCIQGPPRLCWRPCRGRLAGRARPRRLGMRGRRVAWPCATAAGERSAPSAALLRAAGREGRRRAGRRCAAQPWPWVPDGSGACARASARVRASSNGR